MAIFSILALKNRITERFNANRARIISGVDIQEIFHDVIDSLLGSTGTTITNPETRFSDYGLSAFPDGTITEFSTSHPYIHRSTQVYLNGVRQFLGDDYTEETESVISFAIPPYSGDKIIVDYYYLST